MAIRKIEKKSTTFKDKATLRFNTPSSTFKKAPVSGEAARIDVRGSSKNLKIRKGFTRE